MTDAAADDRPPLPPETRTGDERATLCAMLDYYRAVLHRKASGLTHEQLFSTIEPSDLTLGGLILHMAIVEDGWFQVRFGRGAGDPFFTSIPWDSQPDWEFDEAHTMQWSEIEQRWLDTVAASRVTVDSASSLDDLGATVEGRPDVNLRWILVHLIEEYARHAGHADLLRQRADGVTDD